MREGRRKHIVYYQSFDEDMVESYNQQYSLSEDYVWVRDDLVYRFISKVLYGLARALAPVYCRCFLHMRVNNKQLLDQHAGGCCLYANHTQPVGDALLPVWVNRRRRIDVIVSPANLGIPVIGKALPYLGALPATGRIQDTRKLIQAIAYQLQKGHCLVVYPEAHVWPYFTGVRPYSSVSFIYPIRENVPTYCMTTTYQKRRMGSKPRATVWLDGPFYPTEEGTLSEKAENLRQQVHDCMTMRSQSSNYEYICYQKGATV